VSAWKDLERRVCRALGSQRRGQVHGTGWAQGSDSDETGPFSIECKRTTRYAMRRQWIEQARRNAKAEGRPWLLVVAEHNDRRPIAVLSFETLVELAYDAGWLPPETMRRLRLEKACDPDSTVNLNGHVNGVISTLREKGI
jgi:hypothetical protein